MPRQQRALRSGPRRDDDRGGGFGDRSDRRGPGRDSIRYPDSQQIFVGNLPYDIDEADLRDHFSGWFYYSIIRGLLSTMSYLWMYG